MTPEIRPREPLPRIRSSATMSDMVADPARVDGVLFGREPELEHLDALLARRVRG